ncbi:MAG: DNA repair protein RadC [Gammaproteobacteria bacterium]|nr:DNA repair protein RadC [Gammaproteobacteria bacterium]NNC98465.1 DNA repair protein RadC [Gammaproteobacteria bacterium]NNM14772.1 DNA repair protein RadC [Gammaproteobacteria bacterium]
MSIKHWPAAERPREKLLQLGAGNLSDAELLAIFLRTGTRGRTAVDLARELLLHFGDLRKLLTANSKEFCEAYGLGIAKFVQLQAMLELTKRHYQVQLQRSDPLTDPQLTRHYLLHCLRDEPIEKFAALLLDNRHRVIEYITLASGTLNQASVHPREVVRTALEKHAAAIIFAHNHPSGIAEPSAADKRLTNRLKDALALVDIRVLDHFVIGDGEVTSFAERGLL